MPIGRVPPGSAATLAAGTDRRPAPAEDLPTAGPRAPPRRTSLPGGVRLSDRLSQADVVAPHEMCCASMLRA